MRAWEKIAGDLEMGTTFDQDFMDFIFQRRLVANTTILREDSEQGRRHARTPRSIQR